MVIFCRERYVYCFSDRSKGEIRDKNKVRSKQHIIYCIYNNISTIA